MSLSSHKCTCGSCVLLSRKSIGEGVVFLKKPYALRLMAICAMMTALAVVLNRFCSIHTAGWTIGFAFVPVAMTAILYGPAAAAVVGGLADLVGALLFPFGPYFPGFTATAALMGAVYGLFLRRDQRIGSILLAVGVHEFALSLLLNTLWISVLYSSPFLPLLVSRLPQVAVLSVVQVVVIRLLAKALPQLRRLLPQGKAEQRKAALAARRALSKEQRREASTAICAALLELPELRAAGTILSYSALGDEADLAALTEQLGARIALPRCLDRQTMEARIPTGPCKRGPYGIREPDPAASELVAPEEIDLVLVPCVAFDKNRNRLGHGAGYYDRYLPLCTRAKCIAVAFEAQRLPRVVTDAHDRRMDAVVTEKKIYLPE